MRFIVLFLFGIMPSVAFAQASDSVVCKIDGRIYNHRELFGVSYDDMKAEFQQNIKSLSDDALRILLRDAGYFNKQGDNGPALESRSAIETALFDTVYTKTLDQVCRYLLLSHVTQRILKQHGTSVEDFFNIEELKSAIDRQAGLLEYLYKNAKEPAGDDKQLYATAKKEYDTSLTQEEFIQLRKTLAERPFYAQWPLKTYVRSRKVHDYYVQACIAHYLLKEACESGVYRDKAKNIFQRKNSSMVRVIITDYDGQPSALQEYFANVINKDGDIAGAGVQALDTWLSQLDMPISVRTNIINGDKSFSGAPGVLYRTGDRTYEIYAWMTKMEKEPATASQKSGYETFMTVYAYEAGVRRYMPEFQSSMRNWQPDVLVRVQAVSVDGKALVFPEVNIGKFIKKVYPGSFFQDMEDNLPAIEELAIRAAAVVIQKNATEMAKMKAIIEVKKNDAKSIAVKRIYEKLESHIDLEMSTTRPAQR